MVIEMVIAIQKNCKGDRSLWRPRKQPEAKIFQIPHFDPTLPMNVLFRLPIDYKDFIIMGDLFKPLQSDGQAPKENRAFKLLRAETLEKDLRQIPSECGPWEAIVCPKRIGIWYVIVEAIPNEEVG